MSLFSTEPNPYLRLLLVKLLFSFVHGSVPVTQDFKKQGVTDYLQELVSGGRLGPMNTYTPPFILVILYSQGSMTWYEGLETRLE